ncbi:roadblock/LC7 domain-containing protein [Nocardia sp. alder85J]|uniref:roadblock/LC7 domain-containing protein n=1 Tax=Nocardia sp. alder85J TaxID=2862949 RepID=UPI001CD1DC6E|nr:roadblock/LC7 domain-containing protein [Nocardia sp. alder85J]MCX4098561.1 roadblock/LC7 domain-containing protein [Nocardia sp. alder85J]
MTRRLELALGEPGKVAGLLTDACATIDDAAYAFVASRDGLVVASATASETPEDQVALRGSALAAAAMGIGDHFAALSAHGRLQSTYFEADRGCVGIFPISSALMLVVGSDRSVNLGRLTAAAKRILAILQAPSE